MDYGIFRTLRQDKFGSRNRAASALPNILSNKKLVFMGQVSGCNLFVLQIIGAGPTSLQGILYET